MSRAISQVGNHPFYGLRSLMHGIVRPSVSAQGWVLVAEGAM